MAEPPPPPPDGTEAERLTTQPPPPQPTAPPLVAPVAEDEVVDAEADRPRLKKPAPVRVVSLILLAVAVVAPGALVYSVWLPWIRQTATVKAGDKARRVSRTVDGQGAIDFAVDDEIGGFTLTDEDRKMTRAPDDVRPHGGAVLVLAIALSAVGLAGLFLLMPPAPPLGLRQARDVVLAAFLAGAVLAALWELAWIIKVVVLSRTAAEEGVVGASGGPGRSSTVEVMPGLGLYVGMGAALVVAFCVNLVLANVTKRKWAWVGQLAGLALAAAVVLPLVRPWNADALYEALFKN
jgi:hypothetical protein